MRHPERLIICRMVRRNITFHATECLLLRGHRPRTPSPAWSPPSTPRWTAATPSAQQGPPDVSLCCDAIRSSPVTVWVRATSHARPNIYVHMSCRHSDKEDADFKGEVRSSCTLAPCSICLCICTHRECPHDADSRQSTAAAMQVAKHSSVSSAEAVAQCLAKRLPSELKSEVSVVAAIYNLEDGKVDVLVSPAS